MIAFSSTHAAEIEFGEFDDNKSTPEIEFGEFDDNTTSTTGAASQTGPFGTSVPRPPFVTVFADEPSTGIFPFLSTVLLVRVFAALTICLALIAQSGRCCAQATALSDDAIAELIEVQQVSCMHCREGCRLGGPVRGSEPPPGEPDLSWLHDTKAGYDGGFVMASRREQELKIGEYPFQFRFNGWGQLRHTVTDSRGSIEDLNEFQLKRGRLAFSTSAFNSNFATFVQLDGRSSSGDDIRLLDYFLSWDFGHAKLGLERGQLGFRTGKYKVPFTMSRWLSGRDFEFSDRSVASMFFDVNRSFAWGIYGRFDSLPRSLLWEFALFNGLVTGGAETGSAGALDDNFAVSGRAYSILLGEWGYGALADFEWHEEVAMRVGCGFASTQIDRAGETEFDRIRVVDSGERLANLLPLTVERYSVSLFAVDVSVKYAGWSTTLEYYCRNVGEFPGAVVPDLFDHGFWFQLGYFVVPRKLQLISRWSHVVGDSGTLGVENQSSEEVAGGFAYYFRDQHAKLVFDFTYLDGAPINSSALDISPGQEGWLFRSQIQFSF